MIAIGGGSQAVGAMTVARELSPALEVYGVQAAGAQRDPRFVARAARVSRRRVADTFAEGVATRTTYDLTFPALQEGLAGFVTVTDAEIAESLRTIVAETHNLVEGAGAMGVRGAAQACATGSPESASASIFCGGNIDAGLLRRVLAREI